MSPLMRTCETAAGVFGGAASGSPDAGLLMKRQDDARLERSAHGAIALPAGLPFIAEELVRERMGEPLLLFQGPLYTCSCAEIKDIHSHMSSSDCRRNRSSCLTRSLTQLLNCPPWKTT